MLGSGTDVGYAAIGYDDTDCWVHLEDPNLDDIVRFFFVFFFRVSFVGDRVHRI